jgi:hypothetical protein
MNALATFSVLNQILAVGLSDIAEAGLAGVLKYPGRGLNCRFCPRQRQP